MVAVKSNRNINNLSAAPSVTERDKAARTHTAIREHLESDPALEKYGIDTYLQGSYKNSTNVRGDSDVDMGSLTDQVFHYDTAWLPSQPQYRYGQPAPSLKESVDGQLESYGPGGFSFSQYRTDVLASLKRKYGDASVLDGNKAITVLGNTYRLDADVLPCLQFRQYYERSGSPDYHKGIVFWSKVGQRIVNFPHQHFENLSDKDQANDGKVKGCVRIFKRIRNELEENNQWNRKRSPSFYVESLVWNVPNNNFIGGYDAVVQNVLATLWNDLRGKSDDDLGNYSQANKVFKLFHPSFWNAADAFAFVDTLWNEILE